MRLLIILFISFFGVQLQAQSYNKDLTAAVSFFNTLSIHKDFNAATLKFEQIYNTNPQDWIASYYVSILKSRMSLQKNEDSDKLADEALAWIAKSKLVQVNDEILCAESLAYTAKMSVRPGLRWLNYERRIKNPLALAQKINPNNPRIYVLQASLQRNLPVIFGGGCNASLALAQKAEKLLLAQSNDITNLPRWGKQSIIDYKKNCPF
jgi:hypothetical protein